MAGTGRTFTLRFRNATLTFDRTYVVGVVNATPDSFSDGGVFADVEAQVVQGLRLWREGADVIDVGGESTRPQGARPVSAAEEMERVIPVIQKLAERTRAVISVDTTKAEVADAALEAGAEVVNDISGGAFDGGMVDVVRRRGAAYVLGHVRGSNLEEVHAAEAAPPSFDEVKEELARALFRLPAEVPARTVVDPGLGFGKGTAQNVELLRRAGELGAALHCPVMVGPSRKRFLGEITGRGVGDRDDATVGACLAAAHAGADFVRVHDVKRVKDALLVFEKVVRS